MSAKVRRDHCLECGAFLPHKWTGYEQRPTRMEVETEDGEPLPEPIFTQHERVEVWQCSHCGETWSLKELLGGLDWL